MGFVSFVCLFGCLFGLMYACDCGCDLDLRIMNIVFGIGCCV